MPHTYVNGLGAVVSTGQMVAGASGLTQAFRYCTGMRVLTYTTMRMQRPRYSSNDVQTTRTKVTPGAVSISIS